MGFGYDLRLVGNLPHVPILGSLSYLVVAITMMVFVLVQLNEVVALNRWPNFLVVPERCKVFRLGSVFVAVEGL